jgi:GH25 family lysozyme M1 (1,4-beta-N-acetylmuramidase)
MAKALQQGRFFVNKKTQKNFYPLRIRHRWRPTSSAIALRLSEKKEARQPRKAAGQVQGGNASHTAE